MSVIEDCTGNCRRAEALAQTLFLERQDLRNARFSARMAAKEQERLAEQLRGAVEALRESAETLHRVSSWWEHAERSFEDCPAESCVKARAAIGGQ